MKLTREEALKYHRQMWTDMQTALGDNPSHEDRSAFKVKWCDMHFPSEEIDCHCFLCEYVTANYGDGFCEKCPIKWDEEHDNDCCLYDGVNYKKSHISVILALLEREVEDEISDN